MIKELRKDIKARRKELALTSIELAKLANTTQSQILNFENGKANITIDLLGRICASLDVTIKLL